jgi:hypothetical protein
MRYAIAILMMLGIATALACGGSSVADGTCSERGLTCVTAGSGKTCKDSQPYPCPQGGQCCSVD